MNTFGLYSVLSKKIAALPGKLTRRLNHSGEFAPNVARSLAEDFSLEVPFSYALKSGIHNKALAVICHMYHTELAQEIIGYLSNIPVPVSVFISTDTAEKRAVIYKAFATWSSGEVEVRVVSNRGRDIAPKLVTFADVYEKHDLVLFLHSKRSPHLSDGEKWRTYLMRTLLGSPATVASVLELFREVPTLGMVIPQHYAGVRQMIAWGSNFSLASSLASKMNFAIRPDSPLDLPSGSMFWARSSALRPLLDLNLSIEDFPAEAGQIDGTIAHAIERLLLYVCEQAGFGWVKIADRQSSVEQSTIVPMQNPHDLPAYLHEHDFHLLNQTRS